MVEYKYFCDFCGIQLKPDELKIMSLDEKLHDMCPKCYRNFKSYINNMKKEGQANDNK